MVIWLVLFIWVKARSVDAAARSSLISQTSHMWAGHGESCAGGPTVSAPRKEAIPLKTQIINMLSSLYFAKEYLGYFSLCILLSCRFSICCQCNDLRQILSIAAVISVSMILVVIKRITFQKAKCAHRTALKITLPDRNYSQSSLTFQFSVCIKAEKYRCARWSLLCIRSDRILTSNASDVCLSSWYCWERANVRKAASASPYLELGYSMGR